MVDKKATITPEQFRREANKIRGDKEEEPREVDRRFEERRGTRLERRRGDRRGKH